MTFRDIGASSELDVAASWHNPDATEFLTVVLDVTYIAPLPAVDAVLPQHRRFLDEHFATGEFLVSGPRVPRTGGVIIARVAEASRVAELVAADPFTQHGLAAYEVRAFRPTRGPLATLLCHPSAQRTVGGAPAPTAQAN